MDMSGIRKNFLPLHLPQEPTPSEAKDLMKEGNGGRVPPTGRRPLLLETRNFRKTILM